MKRLIKFSDIQKIISQPMNLVKNDRDLDAILMNFIVIGAIIDKLTEG